MNVKSSMFVKASEDAQNNSKEECKEQPIEEKKEIISPLLMKNIKSN
jgi:hypothetical protein